MLIVNMVYGYIVLVCELVSQFIKINRNTITCEKLTIIIRFTIKPSTSPLNNTTPTSLYNKTIIANRNDPLDLKLSTLTKTQKIYPKYSNRLNIMPENHISSELPIIIHLLLMLNSPWWQLIVLEDLVYTWEKVVRWCLIL